jgi:hypothetical protein
VRLGTLARPALLIGFLFCLSGSAAIAARPVAQPAPDSLPPDALYMPVELVPHGWSWVAAASLTAHKLTGCLAAMTGTHNPETVLTDVRRAEFVGSRSATLYQSVGLARSPASAKRLVTEIEQVFAACSHTTSRVQGFVVKLTVRRLTLPLAQADATTSWALTGSKFAIHAEADLVAQARGAQVVITELARNGSDHARLQALVRLRMPSPAH